MKAKLRVYLRRKLYSMLKSIGWQVLLDETGKTLVKEKDLGKFTPSYSILIFPSGFILCPPDDYAVACSPEEYKGDLGKFEKHCLELGNCPIFEVTGKSCHRIAYEYWQKKLGEENAGKAGSGKVQRGAEASS